MKKVAFKIIFKLVVLFMVFLTLPLQAQMTFDSSGNIGIGTETPNYELDIAGTTNTTTLSINSTAVTATASELNYVKNVTASIQDQLDGKANTANPVFTGTATLPGDGAWDSDGYVGIGTTSPTEKLTLADGNFLQTPGDPTLIGSLIDDSTTLLDGAKAICVSGKYAYVAAFDDDGIEILDISDPTNPTHVGSCLDDGPGGTIALEGASSICIAGKYAYVTAFYDHGVAIIDISDPTDPTHVGSIFDDSTTELCGAMSICVVGKYAYIAAYSDEGVEILDISDPTNPTHVGAITNSMFLGLEGACSICVSGKYAYVAASIGNTITILNISNHSNPSKVGMIRESTNPAETALDGARSIYVSGKYAYVAASQDDGVEILDISDPTNPTHVGAILDDDETRLDSAYSIQVRGNYAYIAAASGHAIEILDISDPENPVHVGTSTTGAGYPAAVCVSGKYAYVACYGSSAVNIFDISGLNVPGAQIGSIATNTLNVSENAIIGDHLYVQDGLNVGPGGIKSDGPVSIKDILTLVPRTTNPTSPVSGTLYYNDTDGTLHIYNGTDWNIFSPDP